MKLVFTIESLVISNASDYTLRMSNGYDMADARPTTSQIFIKISTCARTRNCNRLPSISIDFYLKIAPPCTEVPESDCDRRGEGLVDARTSPVTLSCTLTECIRELKTYFVCFSIIKMCVQCSLFSETRVH